MQKSPVPTPCSWLPIKRALRPAKAFQSKYIVDEGKQIKFSGNIVPTQYYNRYVDFQNWFQRGYKTQNKYEWLVLFSFFLDDESLIFIWKKKFGDKDDYIRPPFLIGQFLVRNKIWWYELVSRETLLSSSVYCYL